MKANKVITPRMLLRIKIRFFLFTKRIIKEFFFLFLPQKNKTRKDSCCQMKNGAENERKVHEVKWTIQQVGSM